MPLVTPLNAEAPRSRPHAQLCVGRRSSPTSAPPAAALILAPLLAAALPAVLLADPALAVDPTETQITLPDQMQWKPWSAAGAAGAIESAAGSGAMEEAWAVRDCGALGIPATWSAPHTYVTDRLCFVISGTWWVNSGEKFRAGRSRAGPRWRLRAPGRPYATL